MVQSAYDKAIYLLSSREHTEKELRNKLQTKGFKEEEIDSCVTRLKKEGYLSEERFAEIFIRSRLRKSAEGKSILMMRLLEKGTPRDIAHLKLEEAWEEGLWRESLEEAYTKYESKKGREYAEGKLREKGFSLREIRSVLDGREE